MAPIFVRLPTLPPGVSHTCHYVCRITTMVHHSLIQDWAFVFCAEAE